MKRKQGGFSLIELLIVVAIILIIAAIAIPNFMRSRIGANESSAVASIRQITTAEISYSISFSSIGYADQLGKLGPTVPPGGMPSAASADLLGEDLGCPSATCKKSGYQFNVAAVPGTPISDVTVYGIPQALNLTGIRGFCSLHMGPITYDPAGATACTIPIPQ